MQIYIPVIIDNVLYAVRFHMFTTTNGGSVGMGSGAALLFLRARSETSRTVPEEYPVRYPLDEPPSPLPDKDTCCP